MIMYECRCPGCGDCGGQERAEKAEALVKDLQAVVKAAKYLRDSGYDGPFLGTPTEALFKALRNLD